MLAELALVIAVTISTRVPFLLAPSSDKATQLWITEVYAANRRIAPLAFADSLRQGMLGYPPLPHLLFALLPRSVRPAVATAANLGCDVVHALIIHAAITMCGPAHGDALVSPALAFTLLFTTLPILHPINARLVGIGARTIGPLLVTLYALSLQQAIAGGPVLFHLACIALGIAVILSSQFALQVLTGLSVLLSLVLLSPVPVLLIIAVLGLGMVLPGLNIRAQLRTKLWHYRWYATARNLHIDYRNSIRQMGQIMAGAGLAGVPRLLVYLASGVTPVIVCLGVGTLAISAMVTWPDRVDLAASPLIAFSAAVVAASFVLCAATMAGRLRIFGEAERYIEYAAPFMTLLVALVASVASSDIATVLVLVMVNMAIITANWSIMMIPRLRAALELDLPDDLKAVATYLDMRAHRRIVTSPIFLASALALACKGGHAFLHVLVTEPDGHFSHWTDDLIGYPRLRGDTAHFVSRYGADTMVLARDDMSVIARLDPDADLHTRPIAYENAGYCVIDLAVLPP